MYAATATATTTITTTKRERGKRELQLQESGIEQLLRELLLFFFSERKGCVTITPCKGLCSLYRKFYSY